MSEDPSIWIQLGVKIPDLVAGFLGGVTRAFVFQSSDPVSIIGSIIVGAITANYIGEVASKYTGFQEGTASFIVGLSGMAICQGIIEGVKKWKPPISPADKK